VTLTWSVVFWIVALVLFVVSSFWGPPRVGLQSLGLAFLTLGFLAGQVD
jgi:hypothetical protein